MASSGWQGLNVLKTSSFGMNQMKGDIYISSITHSGNNITINGQFGVYNDGASGYIYYALPITAKITGQSSYTQVASGGQYIYNGQYSATANFSTTINVGAASSSTTVTVDWLYNNGTASNSYTYTLSYDPAVRSVNITGNNVTFDVAIGGSTVASDVSSYSNSSVVYGSSYTVSDIKAVSGYYYTGATSASGTVNSNISLSYSATGRAYKFNVDVLKDGTEDTTGGTGLFDYTITSATGTQSDTQVSDCYKESVPKNATYSITNITEVAPASYYYVGQSSYSGTLTADTSIDLDFDPVIAPSGIVITNLSHTTNLITWLIEVNDFGAPASASGRTIKLYDNNNTLLGTITDASSGQIVHPVASCASGYVYAVVDNTHTSTTTQHVAYDMAAFGYPVPSSASFLTMTANSVSITMNVSAWNGNCSQSQGYFTYSYMKNGQTISGNTAMTSNLSASATITGLTTDEVYTLSWVAHNNAGNTAAGQDLDFHGVRTPSAPVLAFQFSNLNRTCTLSVTAGTIYDVASLENTVIDIALDSNFTNIVDTVTATTATYSWVKDYVKPFIVLYARARTTNSLSMSSPYAYDSVIAPSIIWGVADVNGTKYDIIDIREMKPNGTLTPANWVENQWYGTNRIVKKTGL